MNKLIIFPSEFGKTDKIDSCYEDEYKAALDNNFDTVIFNYDEYFTFGKELKFNKKLDKQYECAIYRGWMISGQEYARFYGDLKRFGISLINNPSEYLNTHHFKNSYEKIKDKTPKTLYFNKAQINWDEVRENFDKFIVKDDVKSVKGFDFPEYLESSMTDEQLNDYIKQFRELRDTQYSGGITLKEYINIDKNSEFRVFILNKKPIYASMRDNNIADCNNWTVGIQENTINVYDKNGNKLFSTDTVELDSNFYTIDYIRKENGEFCIMEIGDGQVSGLEKGTEQLFYKGMPNK